MKRIKPKIYVAMIIKNEEKVIKRCIKSAQKKVEGFVIFDNGSTDKTINVLERLRDDDHINIILKTTTWKNFGENRTEVFDYIHENIPECDYTIVLDADDVLKGKLSIKKPIDVGQILVKTNGIDHVHRRLFNMKKFRWEYRGKVHEYPCTTGENAGTEVDEMVRGIWIEHNSDGISHEDANAKADMFIDLLEKSDQNDPRNVFYLGQTLRGKGDLNGAREAYSKRLKMEGFYQEKVVSALNLARMMHAQGQHDAALMMYLKTFEMDPDRSEAAKEIVKIANKTQMFNIGLWAGKQILLNEKKNVSPATKLLYEGAYPGEFTLRDIGLCAYYANPKDEETAKHAWERILSEGHDEENKKTAIKNLTWIKLRQTPKKQNASKGRRKTNIKSR
jgi:glycosyltransferase involved in cell wall biosynthesis